MNKWKNGTTSLVNLGQKTVKLGSKVHRQLHEAFDTAYKEFRRREGWRNIAARLSQGKTTPAELFDAMENVTRQFLKGPQLQQALSELGRLRKLF
ncbi:MAG TPA: hypothetical protein PKC45_19370 [Gemmatales bacterium]|nr:hypothetical protein [Gemmatales bacterium]